MMMSKKTKIFEIVIEKEPYEEGYYSYCPSLHGCFSNGSTIEETRNNMKESIELYLESITELGLTIPVKSDQIVVEEMIFEVHA